MIVFMSKSLYNFWCKGVIMKNNKERILKEFLQDENESLHSPYNEEFIFYTAVQTGNLKLVKQLCEQESLDKKKGLGMLSDNPIRNLRYHFIISTALISRFCIEGGMEHEAAYQLSDYYIQKIDKCDVQEEIIKLHIEMCIRYTMQMKQNYSQKIYSKPIVLCIDYIHSHLHSRIKVEELADFVNLNPSYLSLLFKKETGFTISDYILQKKIQTAKSMLKYSDYSYAEIANILAFASQSYFIQVFKKKTGFTPKEFRNLHFRDLGI